MYKALLGFACVLLSGNAAGAQIAYISDDVGVFLHRGPSKQFKLVGTVPAGSRVTLVDRNEMTGYVKIVDGEGKSGWVEERFVGTEISRRERGTRAGTTQGTIQGFRIEARGLSIGIDPVETPESNARS